MVLVERGIGVRVRSEEVLNDGGIVRKGVLCAMPALSVKTNVFVRKPLRCDLSREALEPHAHVINVRDADRRSYGTLREKNHVCGNMALRAGLVSCVHPGRLQEKTPLPVSENTLKPF